MKFGRNHKNHKGNRHIFLLTFGLSTCLIAFLGIMGRNSLYADYETDVIRIPQLAVVFQGMKEAKYPWQIFTEKSAYTSGDSSIMELGENTRENTTENATENNTKEDNNSEENEAGNEESDLEEIVTGHEGSDSEKNEVGSGESTFKDNDITQKDGNKSNAELDNKSESDHSTKTEQDKKFETVEADYFKDALFIGDSRTIGLQEYSGLSEPTYYAYTGLSIYQIFSKDIAEIDGKMMTIDKALEQKKFGKIYIMLGINELGTGTAQSFAKEYEVAIRKIQELQPDAIIFIESIMNVSKEKSDKDKIFTNANIKDRNDVLAQLADEKKVFYIDINEAFVDSTGAIPAEYTFDGIHIKAAYYKLWSEVLLKHGIK